MTAQEIQRELNELIEQGDDIQKFLRIITLIGELRVQAYLEGMREMREIKEYKGAR